MRVIVVLLLLLIAFSGCAQQPTQQEVGLWSYFFIQCENEGVPRTNVNAMHGCITVKLQQTNVGSGDVLQAMGYTLMQGTSQPQAVDCHTTTLVGGYRTVCQ